MQGNLIILVEQDSQSNRNVINESLSLVFNKTEKKQKILLGAKFEFHRYVNGFLDDKN